MAARNGRWVDGVLEAMWLPGSTWPATRERLELAAAAWIRTTYPAVAPLALSPAPRYGTRKATPWVDAGEPAPPAATAAAAAARVPREVAEAVDALVLLVAAEALERDGWPTTRPAAAAADVPPAEAAGVEASLEAMGTPFARTHFAAVPRRAHLLQPPWLTPDAAAHLRASVRRGLADAISAELELARAGPAARAYAARALELGVEALREEAARGRRSARDAAGAGAARLLAERTADERDELLEPLAAAAAPLPPAVRRLVWTDALLRRGDAARARARVARNVRLAGLGAAREAAVSRTLLRAAAAACGDETARALGLEVLCADHFAGPDPTEPAEAAEGEEAATAALRAPQPLADPIALAGALPPLTWAWAGADAGEAEPAALAAMLRSLRSRRALGGLRTHALAARVLEALARAHPAAFADLLALAATPPPPGGGDGDGGGGDAWGGNGSAERAALALAEHVADEWLGRGLCAALPRGAVLWAWDQCTLARSWEPLLTVAAVLLEGLRHDVRRLRERGADARALHTLLRARHDGWTVARLRARCRPDLPPPADAAQLWGVHRLDLAHGVAGVPVAPPPPPPPPPPVPAHTEADEFTSNWAEGARPAHAPPMSMAEAVAAAKKAAMMGRADRDGAETAHEAADYDLMFSDEDDEAAAEDAAARGRPQATLSRHDAHSSAQPSGNKRRRGLRARPVRAMLHRLGLASERAGSGESPPPTAAAGESPPPTAAAGELAM